MKNDMVISKLQQTELKAPKANKLQVIWKFRVFYVMLIPGLIYYLIYRYGPMYGAVIAFKDFNINDGILGSPWANPFYKHFEFFFRSPYFTQLLTNTLLISAYKLVCEMPFSISLAILLNEVKNRYFKSTIQTLTYLPYFLSWVIVYGIAVALFSEADGLINMYIKQNLGTSIPFLSSPEWFRGIIVGTEV